MTLRESIALLCLSSLSLFYVSPVLAVDSVNHILPTATKYVLETTSINCLLNVCVAFFLSFCAVFAWSLFFGIGIRHSRHSEDYYNKGEWNAPSIIRCIVACFLTAVAIIDQAANMWSYIGIFHPELYLVHQTMSAVSL